MWLFDEAHAIYQVGDGTALSSSFNLMIGAEDCSEEDDLALLPAVALDILEIEVSLDTAVLDTEDGTWVVVDVDAIAGLKVAVVAWLLALVISFVFIFIVFINGFGSFKEKKENTGQPVVHLSFCPVSGIPGKQAWRPVTGTLPATRYITLIISS